MMIPSRKSLGWKTRWFLINVKGQPVLVWNVGPPRVINLGLGYVGHKFGGEILTVLG
jgi:hypothetical protein